MESGLRQSGRVSGASRELGKRQREELASSLLSRSGDGEGSLHGPPSPAAAALLCSSRPVWFTLYTVSPFHQRPQGTPPNSPRVQGSVLGEVLAASPDHQRLAVRTDVPWDGHQ